MSGQPGPTHVVIVGGGFAGVACARRLAAEKDLDVTLIDRNNYHQFQPLLYQVATSSWHRRHRLPTAKIARQERRTSTVKLAEVVAIDPTAQTRDDAMPARPGRRLPRAGRGLAAEFLQDARAPSTRSRCTRSTTPMRLRARILEPFEEADRDPRTSRAGALEFVVVGGGPTGVEVAGALAEMIHDTMAPSSRPGASDARVHLVDHGHALLEDVLAEGPRLRSRVLAEGRCELRLGVGVTEIGPGHVKLSDGSTIRTRCVIWGGGLKAAPIAATAGCRRGAAGGSTSTRTSPSSGCPASRHRRHRQHPGQTARRYPQLGSVALQSGVWAAKNILAELEGKHPKPFSLPRQGDMAMIGRGSAIAQVRRHRAARQARVRRLARRPRRADDRRQQPGRRVQELGGGLLRQGARAARRSTGAARRGWTGRTTSRRDRRPTAGACAMTTDHDYDVIIIGSGAGGGTLAAASGAVGQADPPARARRLAAARSRELGRRRGVRQEPLRREGHLVRRAGQGLPARDPLLRRRGDEVLRRGPLPPAQGGLRRAAPSRRHLAGVADHVRGDRACTHEGRAPLRGPRQPRRGPDRAAASADYPFPAVTHEPRIQQLSDDLERAGLPPVPRAVRRACSKTTC